MLRSAELRTTIAVVGNQAVVQPRSLTIVGGIDWLHGIQIWQCRLLPSQPVDLSAGYMGSERTCP